MKKISSIIGFLVFLPLVSAGDGCSLLNLASCIPQKLFDFFLGILNAPIIPLLDLTKSLLIDSVRIDLFVSLWAIILYILSMFYGILMIYSGFNFMFSGNNAIRRAKAKEWFMNIFIMIVLIQASYFLYSLTLDLNTLMTAGIMNFIEDRFFLITADSFVNLGLQFLFSLLYALTIVVTILLLAFRYIIVAAGVVFIPIGIFCYFIPPLKEYGKLIFNFLGISIFSSFFSSLILLVCSRLIEIELFHDFKILVMVSAFGIINLLMFYLLLFSAIKSAMKTVDSNAGAIASAAKYFV